MKKFWLSISAYLFVHLMFYIFGCFVSWDFNPMNWWLFTSTIGRIITLIIELIFIGNILLDD